MPGGLVYLDRKTGEKTECKECSLAARDFSLAEDVIRGASFSGSFDCREVLQKDFRIGNLKSAVRTVVGPGLFGRLPKGRHHMSLQLDLIFMFLGL